MKIKLSFLLAFLVCSLSMQAQNRVVLIEEGTGTWCQWCPRGAVLGHDIIKNNPGKVLQIAVHQNDPMEIQGSTYSSDLGVPGFPSGNIDRANKGIDPTNWQSNVASRLTMSSPVDVTVSRSYNSSNRELTVTVGAKFNTAVPSGSYKIGVVLTEDGVTGKGSKYAQTNKYSGGANGPMGGYEKLPNPVPALFMVYDHVARKQLTSYAGESGIIPNSPSVGQTYSKTYKVTLDQSFDEEYIRAVCFVTDVNGAVLNAGGTEYAQGDKNARPMFHSEPNAVGQLSVPFTYDVLCHDPDNDNLTITAVGSLPSWLTLAASGKNDAVLSGTPTSAGTFNFTLEVSDGTKKRTQAFTLVINPKGSSWLQMGKEGFSAAPSKYVSPSAIDVATGHVYTMAVAEGDIASIYKYDNSKWTQLGSTVSAYSLYADITFNKATKEPWIFVKDGSDGKVYKYSNSAWTQVGNSFPATSNMGIRITKTGEAYVAYSNGAAGLELRKLSGTTWSSFAKPTSTNLLSWPKLEINNQNNPVVLAAEFASQTGYSKVFEYDGTKWVQLGSGAINPSEYTNPSSSSAHQLAVNEKGEIVVGVAFNSGTNVYQWNGSSWKAIATNIDDGISDAFDVAIDNAGKVFAVYQTNINKATCKTWDGISWKAVGVPNFTTTIRNISMFLYAHGTPGVVYADMDQAVGKLSAKRFLYPTSVETIVEHQRMIIYPNPVKHTIHIKGVDVSGHSFDVYDVSGKVVLRGVVRNGEVAISRLNVGTYFMHIEGVGQMAKFIKL